MKTLRVFLSLLFLAVVLSFGFAHRAKAEGGYQCNCYIGASGKYGTIREGVCFTDSECWIVLD